MPVNGDPISPNQPGTLQSKIDAYDVTKLEDRKAISKEVLVDLGKKKASVQFAYTKNEQLVVKLNQTTCMVFIIRGSFQAGSVTYTGTLVGYNLVDESQITLLENTELVIIYT